MPVKLDILCFIIGVAIGFGIVYTVKSSIDVNVNKLITREVSR